MKDRFGKLEGGRLVVAPTSLETADGVVMNPTPGRYLAEGWKRIFDDPPEAEEGDHADADLPAAAGEGGGSGGRCGGRASRLLEAEARRRPEAGGPLGPHEDVDRGAGALRPLPRRAGRARGQRVVRARPRRAEGALAPHGRGDRGDPRRVHGGLKERRIGWVKIRITRCSRRWSRPCGRRAASARR